MTNGAAYHPRAMAMLGLFGPPLRRASLVGAVVGVAAGAVTAAAATLAAPPGGVATLLLVAGPAIVTAALGTATAMLLVPRRVAAAYAAFSWLGHREVARFREQTASRVPGGPEAARVWLEANPRTPAAAEARVELLVGLGRFDEARAELAALRTPVTDHERLAQASLEVWCDIVETGDADLEALDAVARAMPDRAEPWLEGAVVRALAETRLRAIRGEPHPLDPLGAVRPRLGREAALVVLRDTWLRLAGQLLVIGAAVGAVSALFRPGPWG